MNILLDKRNSFVKVLVSYDVKGRNYIEKRILRRLSRTIIIKEKGKDVNYLSSHNFRTFFS